MRRGSLVLVLVLAGVACDHAQTSSPTTPPPETETAASPPAAPAADEAEGATGGEAGAATPTASASATASDDGTGTVVAISGDPTEGGQRQDGAGAAPVGAGIGSLGGGGTASGYGRGAGHATTRGAPVVKIAQPEVSGSLDKDVIRRVIRQNIARLRYCYEKQLVTHPKLEGRVETRFTIDPTGKVTTATATGLDTKVDRCIERALLELRFPAPKGGGKVTVAYPFVFRAS